MTNPVDINRATAARRLTIWGSNWLWVVAAIMGISTLVALVWSKFVSLSIPCLAQHFLTGAFTESNHAGHRHSTILL